MCLDINIYMRELISIFEEAYNLFGVKLESVDVYEVKHINGKSNIKTKIKPEDRTMANIPKFSTGKLRVNFRDWLGLTGSGAVAKSPNGKWYGWSHRALYGFGIGDKIKKGDIVYKGTEYTIKTDSQAREVATLFSDNVS